MKRYAVVILFFLSTLSALLGNPVFGQNISGVVNTYYKVTGINTTTNTLTLSSAAGLSPGIKILIIQMKGAAIDNANAASFGNITSVGNAGNYEFNFICGVSGNDVLLMFDMIKTYDVGGLVQLVTVPRYTDAVVTDTLKAAPWNPTSGTGGIIAIEALNSITLTKPIDASGMGFKGGVYIDHPQPPYNCDFSTNITAYGFANPASGFQTGGPKGEGITVGTAATQCGRGKLANGGGGANNHNCGGAGGSNYGTGGAGGQRTGEGSFNCHGMYPGIGGLSLSSQGYSTGNNRVFMGGGGGAGQGNNNVGMDGGDGGGIVFIKTNTFYGNNELVRANGNAPYRAALQSIMGIATTAGGDGGGGGGGGGVVIFDVAVCDGNVTLQANGGRGSDAGYPPSTGSCFGPGGGGGGGVLWVRGPALVPEINTSFTGGANGVGHASASVVACRGQANSATPGGNGNVLFNYVPPASVDFLCAPLPANDLLYFSGKELNEGVELYWKVRNTANVSGYVIERSVDKVRFDAIANLQSNGRSFIDRNVQDEYTYYRLKMLYRDGSVLYSAIILVHIKHNSFQLLSLSPNPATDDIKLLVKSPALFLCTVEIYSRTGQLLLSQKHSLRNGVSQVSIPVEPLAGGVYFIAIRQDDKRIVRSFVKQ